MKRMLPNVRVKPADPYGLFVRRAVSPKSEHRPPLQLNLPITRRCALAHAMYWRLIDFPRSCVFTRPDTGACPKLHVESLPAKSPLRRPTPGGGVLGIDRM